MRNLSNLYMKTGKIIIFVVPDLKGHGAQRVVITLAKYLRKAGHRSHVVCFTKKIGFPIPRDIPVHFFPALQLRWLPRALRFRLSSLIFTPLLDHFIKIKCQKPDLVISNLLFADQIMAFSKLNNVYLLIHNTLSLEMRSWIDSGNGWNEFLALYEKKKLICVSKGVLQDLKKFFPGRPVQDLSHIYNPVDVDLIRLQARQKINEHIDSAIIHVGRASRAKRHDRLLRAYALSGVKNHLVLIGDGQVKQAVELAHSLGIAERVYFLGFRSNPYAYMARASLFVLSSDYEGLPTVILEAIALGVPVVSTDCPSGPSEILPERNLVAPDHVDALAFKIKDALMNPGTYRAELDKKFTPAVCIKQYLALIREQDTDD